jgi:hypothetical protein
MAEGYEARSSGIQYRRCRNVALHSVPGKVVSALNWMLGHGSGLHPQPWKGQSWFHWARLFEYSSSFPLPRHPSVDLTIFLIPLLLLSPFCFPSARLSCHHDGCSSSSLISSLLGVVLTRIACGRPQNTRLSRFCPHFPFCPRFVGHSQYVSFDFTARRASLHDVLRPMPFT